MHKVIIIALQGKLKLFEECGQIFLFGESKAIADEDKSWQRIIDNINILPQNLSVLLIYDNLSSALINQISKYFSQSDNLRLFDIKSFAEELSALYGMNEFIFCGLVARFDSQGELQIDYTENSNIEGLNKVSFKGTFSQTEKIVAIKRELRDVQRNFERLENKLKTLNKKFNR